MAKVSVVVPVFNAEEYLDETLASLCRQTLDDLEFICVDDGSTDRSRDILGAMADRDPRFRLIEKANGGVGSARNLGIESTTGEYLSFIDSDDIVSDDYLEELYSSTSPEKPDIVVTGNVLEYWPDGRRNARNVGVTGDALLITPGEKAPLITSTGLTQNKLYRSAFIHGIGLRHYSGKSVSEDNYFNICAIALARSIKTIRKGSYFYRQRPQSLTKVRKRPDDVSIYDVYKQARAFVATATGHDQLASEWEPIIRARQQTDLTNYHFELSPPDRAGFREQTLRLTGGRIRIPRPDNERRTIIKFHIKSALASIGLYHSSR